VIFVYIFLALTLYFFIRALAGIAAFFKWRKKERAVGTVGELIESRANAAAQRDTSVGTNFNFVNLPNNSRSRKYVYAFSIETPSETISTTIVESKVLSFTPKVYPGKKLDVFLDRLTGTYRTKPDMNRYLCFHPLLFAIFAVLTYAIYYINTGMPR
jgi:hypothetical protein